MDMWAAHVTLPLTRVCVYCYVCVWLYKHAFTVAVQGECSTAQENQRIRDPTFWLRTFWTLVVRNHFAYSLSLSPPSLCHFLSTALAINLEGTCIYLAVRMCS